VSSPSQGTISRKLRLETDERDDVIRQLLLRQRELEARLARVEDSVFFRALRWMGKTARRWTRSRTPFATPLSGPHPEYARWVEQTGWMQPSARECARRAEGWRKPVAFSYLMQSPPDGPPPLACQVLEFNSAASWQQVLRQARGEFSAIVPAGVALSPLAGYRWGQALQHGDTDAIYSDWDHLTESGRRHSPRFTPQLSGELLRRTCYWGSCFVVRSELLRCCGAGLDPVRADWTHLLASRIAESAEAISRVPEVLWHSTGTPAVQEALDSGADRGDAELASIVVCSRTPRLLQRCLRALRRTDAAKAEIVVVAHACGQERRLEEVAAAEGARAVRYSGQFHFGLMSTLGVELSSRPTLVFLNDDVEPVAPDWLGALLGPLDRQDVGITGGLLLYPEGTVQHAGISVGMRTSPAHPGRGQTCSPWWPWLRLTREVAAVTGACLAIRRTLWEELDGFDRRFHANYNDVDLCLRARRAGYSVVLESRAVLHHREARTRAVAVTPAERSLFWSLWARELSGPDPFFTPNLILPDEKIRLASPAPVA